MRPERSLALRAELANRLEVLAGIAVSPSKVGVDVRGLDARTSSRMRLERLAEILGRAQSTLNRNPQIGERLEGDAAEERTGPS
jgi:hypothetical protein